MIASLAAVALAQAPLMPLATDPPPLVPPGQASTATLAAILIALTGLASATLPQFVSAYRSWLDDRRAAREAARAGQAAEARRTADRLAAIEARVFGPGGPPT